MNTNIYLTGFDDFGPCVWELEIINHERVFWLNNILQKEPDPAFDSYLNDVLINREL